MSGLLTHQCGYSVEVNAIVTVQASTECRKGTIGTRPRVLEFERFHFALRINLVRVLNARGFEKTI